MDKQELLAVPDEISPDERDLMRETDAEQKNTEPKNENSNTDNTEDIDSAAPEQAAENTEDGETLLPKDTAADDNAKVLQALSELSLDTEEESADDAGIELQPELFFPPVPPKKDDEEDTASVEPDENDSESDTDMVFIKPENKKKPFKKAYLWWIIPSGLILLALLGYLTFVFAPIPFVRFWRNIYIETAMTTADHQWLATKFIPAKIINEVWHDEKRPEVEAGFENLRTVETDSAEPPALVLPDDENPESGEHTQVIDPPETEHVIPIDPHHPEKQNDILGLSELKAGEKDYAGYKVLTIDKEEGLYIAEITGKSGGINTFRGRVMLVDDPARIFVGTTPEKKVRGYRIKEMMAYYGDVIAGINASGFADPNDSGDGKDIVGFCMSEGETWGYYNSYYTSIVFTTDNKLVIGNISDWSKYNIRDGMQFGPALIANGVKQFSDSGGYGLHPRTAIGQREDGAIILLVIDGRDPAYSVGCTMLDLANVMEAYGAVNAGCCDGGSSCVLAYDGEVINHNSSANPSYGRRIPNAFLVRSKKGS